MPGQDQWEDITTVKGPPPAPKGSGDWEDVTPISKTATVTPDAPASALSRFGSGVVSGAKAMNPLSGGVPSMSEIAMSGLGPIPGMVRSAVSGYKSARADNQPVISSIASGAGSMIGLDPQGIRDRASQGDIAGIAGEAVPSIAATLLGGETFGREARVGGDSPGIVAKNPGLIRGVTRDVIGKYVGPRLADALVPQPTELPSAGHSVPLGPDPGEFYANRGQDLINRGGEQAGIDRTAQADQNRLEKATQAAKDQRDSALTQHGQDLMKRQAEQDRLDAAKTKADNALARSQRQSQTQQGQDMTNEIEYNKEMSRKATEAADENRQRNTDAAKDEEDRIQSLHENFAKSLSDLETSRQKTLSDRGRLNDQWGQALSRRGDGPGPATLPAPAQGVPSDIATSGLGGNDLISRTRRLTIPGEEPSFDDVKRAGDATQAPTERLKVLARFGDKIAQNELNRRLKN